MDLMPTVGAGASPISNDNDSAKTTKSLGENIVAANTPLTMESKANSAEIQNNEIDFFAGNTSAIPLDVIPPDEEVKLIDRHVAIEVKYALSQAGTTRSFVGAPSSFIQQAVLKLNLAISLSAARFNSLARGFMATSGLSRFSVPALTNIFAKNIAIENPRLKSASFLLFYDKQIPAEDSLLKRLAAEMATNNLYLAEWTEGDILADADDVQKLAGLLKAAGINLPEDVTLATFLQDNNLTLHRGCIAENDNLLAMKNLQLYQSETQGLEQEIFDKNINIIRTNNPQAAIKELNSLNQRLHPGFPLIKHTPLLPCSILINNYQSKWPLEFTVLPCNEPSFFTRADKSQIPCTYMFNKLYSRVYDTASAGLNERIMIFSIPLALEQNEKEARVIIVSNLDTRLTDDEQDKINEVIQRIVNDVQSYESKKTELTLPMIDIKTREDAHDYEDRHNLGGAIFPNEEHFMISAFSVNTTGTTMYEFSLRAASLSSAMSDEVVRIRLDRPFLMTYYSPAGVDISAMVNEPINHSDN